MKPHKWAKENQRFIGLAISVSDIWFGAYWMIEKCTWNDWWLLPSFLTIVGIWIFGSGLLTGAIKYD